jgi:hypothetical protein
MKCGLAVAVLACGLLPSAARSFDRLSVEVVCEVAEHRYRLGFAPGQISGIETDCGRQLAGLLAQRVRFLHFTSGAARNNRLVVRVGKSASEADPRSFRPVDMEVFVQGDDVAPGGEPVAWNFRALDEYLQVPSAESFADAVALRFADELQRNEAHLVEAQLSRLRIAESAFPIPEDQSWLLPFERGDLGIADASLLQIKAELRTPSSNERFTYTVELFGDFTSGAGVPPEFHNKLKALHIRDDKLAQDASIERLRAAEQVDVLYVAISRYVRAIEPNRTSPSELDLE